MKKNKVYNLVLQTFQLIAIAQVATKTKQYLQKQLVEVAFFIVILFNFLQTT